MSQGLISVSTTGNFVDGLISVFPFFVVLFSQTLLLKFYLHGSELKNPVFQNCDVKNWIYEGLGFILIFNLDHHCFMTNYLRLSVIF